MKIVSYLGVVRVHFGVHGGVPLEGGVARGAELFLERVKARLVESHARHRLLHVVRHQFHVEDALFHDVLAADLVQGLLQIVAWGQFQGFTFLKILKVSSLCQNYFQFICFNRFAANNWYKKGNNWIVIFKRITHMSLLILIWNKKRKKRSTRNNAVCMQMQYFIA